jgi:hypothetical protein
MANAALIDLHFGELIWCESVHWIELAHDGAKWRTFLKAVLDFWVVTTQQKIC